MNRPTFPPAATPARRTLERVHVAGGRGGSGTDLPVIVLERGVDGPTAVVCANLHGDETTGLGVVRRLDDWLGRNDFAGRVVLYPSCNPQGLRAQTRHVPADELDLNRAFPGNARGSWASRIAWSVWQDLVARSPDVLIDLHADSPLSLPYVIVDRPVRATAITRRRLGRRVLELANASGLTVLREYPDEVYVQFGLDRSLAGSVVNLLGVPAVTVEVGPRRYLDAAAVDVALQATLGILHAVGNTGGAVPVHASRVAGGWRRSSTPRTCRGGLVEPTIQPGETFVKGDLLAQIVDLTGAVVEDVIATEDGLLVSWVEGAWAAPGGLLGTLGVPDGERL